MFKVLKGALKNPAEKSADEKRAACFQAKVEAAKAKKKAGDATCCPGCKGVPENRGG